MSRGQLEQVAQLARRSAVRTLRQPSQVVPALAFPCFLLAVNTGGLGDATHLPGFPTSSYLTFALAVTFTQGGLFALTNAGTDLAGDIETGFLNRLALTPLRGMALVAGMLAGSVALGLLQALTYLTVGLAAGAHLAAGAAGVPVVFALTTLTVLAFASLGTLAALRTGSAEAVQSLFPLVFVSLFLSSMLLPRDLIEHGWFRTVAGLNPVSYVIEGYRSLLVTGWDAHALALAFAMSGGIVAVGLGLSSLALKTRLTRT